MNANDRTYLGYDGRLHRLRDNLLVTIGCRAGSMSALGYIDLPTGANGEDVLAIFCERLADDWLSNEDGDCFDEFIETALEARFPKEA